MAQDEEVRLKIEDVQTFIGGKLKKERSLPIVKHHLYKNLIQLHKLIFFYEYH